MGKWWCGGSGGGASVERGTRELQTATLRQGQFYHYLSYEYIRSTYHVAPLGLIF